ncbi:hypothetical protein Pfo_028707 [Paulownia fortunei]|nr:hypothetical protein Pfo_028707 [Paulownia fortunei]
MALLPEHLNFILIPLMAPGHIIPMIDMAKLLAERSVRVTIISGLSIRLLQIRFPCQEAGLPPGCESADSLPSYDLIRNFFVAINMLQQPLEEIQLIMHRLYVSKIHESVPPTEPFVVPGLPDRIEFTKLQLPGMFNPGSMDVGEFREQVRKTESLAYGVVLNSFEGLEKRYLDEFRKVKGGKVWSIGPLSLCSNDNLDRAQRGNQASIDTEQCLKWLDNRKPGSVIYACLGSLSRLSPDQFIELALGLESSSFPFILVVKGGAKSAEIEKWILDVGFEERTKERGLLIRGWAPQVLILSHSSIGGFLTHCGWNSTLEGICAGLPMITWPIFAEQFLNEKLVVQILETGVGVGAQAVIHLGEEEKPENKVMFRDGIKTAIERVMDKGKEGCERRKKAQVLGEMAKRSVEIGGSSHLNITLLIQEIAQLGKSKQGIE